MRDFSQIARLRCLIFSAVLSLFFSAPLLPERVLSDSCTGNRFIMNAEQSNLFATQLRNAKTDQEKLSLLNSLNYRYYFSPEEDRLRYSQMAKAIAIRLRNRPAELIAMCNLAFGNYRRKEYLTCLDTFLQSRKLSELLRDNPGVVSINIEIANIFRFCWNDLATARIYCKQAEEVSRACGYRLGLVRSLNNIGDIHFKYGELEQATHYFLAALQISEQDKSLIGKTASITANLCEVYIMLEEYDLAKESIAKTAALYQQINDFYGPGPARVHFIMGELSQKQGNYNQAMVEFERSRQLLDLIPTLGQPPQRFAEVLAAIGEIYSLQNKYEKATQFFNDAKALQMRIDDNHGYAQTLCRLGTTYTRMRELNLAEQKLSEAMRLCLKDDNLLELKNIYHEMETIATLRNDTAATLKYRKLFDETQEKLLGTRVTAAILSILRRYEKEKLLEEITREKRSKMKWILIYGFCVFVLVLLTVALLWNNKGLKKWARGLLAVKEMQLAGQKSQLEMLRGKLAEMKNEGNRKKTLGNSLTEEQAQHLLKKLITLIEEKKPYLDCNLSLQKLAEQLNINIAYLSRVINSLLGKSFTDFINNLRVEEVKTMLANQANRSRAILQIAMEAGFNSKSVFNRVFKHETGLTPTRYRERLARDLAKNKSTD